MVMTKSRLPKDVVVVGAWNRTHNPRDCPGGTAAPDWFPAKTAAVETFSAVVKESSPTTNEAAAGATELKMACNAN